MVGVYPPRARARLALAVAARNLSDLARGAVRTTADRYAHEGEAVEDALRLVAAAEEVLNRAVVWEREKGTTWEVIAEALGGRRKQTAQERFAGVVARWKAALLRPWQPATDQDSVYSALPSGAEDPAQWASRLDAWCRRHREPTDVDRDDPQPVSGGLKADPTDVLFTVVQLLHHQAMAMQDRRLSDDPPHPVEVQAYANQVQELAAWLDAYLAGPHPEEPAVVTLAVQARRGLAGLVELVGGPEGRVALEQPPNGDGDR
jgi:hypothetical protein